MHGKIRKVFSYLMALIFILTAVFPAIAANNNGSYPVAGAVLIQAQPMQGDQQKYELVVNEKVVIRYRSAYGGLTASERSGIILDRLKDLAQYISHDTVTTANLNGAPVILVNDRLLVTVTQADWEANNSSGEGLARVWASNIIQAFTTSTAQNPPAANNPPDDENPPAVENPPLPDSSGQEYASADELKMLDLINQERQKAGVAKLTMDPELVKIARLKSQDMIDKNYFDHTSPTYGDPFTMMKNYGIRFTYAGENLAGNQSVEAAHQALMNSPGHRANILNPNYSHMGIGIIKGGPYGAMFTQEFIKKP